MTNRREFLRWLTVAGVGVTAAGVLPAAARAETGVTVVRGGTVIDGTGARPRQADVVLVGEHVAGVGHGAPVPEGAVVVDARGRYVIPGLWDMHTHGSDLVETFPPLHLVNGVTGIREMWGYPENRAVRDRIEQGTLLGPRMIMASSIVDGPVSLLAPPVTKVSTPDEARAAVRTAKAERADFVKIYSYLTPDLFAAVADESWRQGLPFGGHLPYRLTPRQASDLGQRVFEHLHAVYFSASSREAELRRVLDATPFDPADPRAFFRVARALEREAALSYDPAKARSLFAHLARRDTWQSPTLKVNQVMTSPADTFANDPRLRYIPDWLEQFWAQTIKNNAPVTPEEIAAYRAYFEAQLRLTKAACDAGSGILGGTDCLNPYVLPGFGTHDELELLVRAGLSPMAALQTMTRDAARFLGLGHRSGTLTAGKWADLVVLDADPLADIRNSAKVHAVVTRGRLIDAARREAMLAEVEKAAQQPPDPARLAALHARPQCACA
ncbi:amidohydrolase family protein [Amycolatopsis suaedae]|uniref:Amidohydrolase n=1 Tax=Amycolatopsis suaedae TaxID=2510978 RepID=A0A4Q7J545_9PSEU|nr:amidohydrolase family protein [Amycolatopsis suaedae]RZQ61846.1 amidohydrolase [Amycolatopsis suaedae]